MMMVVVVVSGSGGNLAIPVKKNIYADNDANSEEEDFHQKMERSGRQR